MPKGSIRGIISQLSKTNLDLNGLDSVIVRFFGLPQSGWIDMGRERMSKGDFLFSLIRGNTPLVEVKLIPGETMYFFIKDLATKLQIQESELWESYKKYTICDDGYIYPDTYRLPFGADSESIITFLLNSSKEKYSNLLQSVINAQKILVIASIIQKEAANNDEMPLVSAVVFNRLNKGMPLQMDGSLNYGKYSHTKVTPERIRNDTSAFNTYRNRGIPKCPVASVSNDAILAAMNPANVSYLYFVKNKKSGVHSFSNTYKEHLKNIK